MSETLRVWIVQRVGEEVEGAFASLEAAEAFAERHPHLHVEDEDGYEVRSCRAFGILL